MRLPTTIILLLLLTATVAQAYDAVEIPQTSGQHRLLDNKLIISDNSSIIRYYDENLNTLASINISPYTTADDAVAYGVPDYESDSSLSWICDNSASAYGNQSVCRVDSNGSFTQTNLAGALGDYFLQGAVFLHGSTEGYYYVSLVAGSTTYFITIPKDNHSEYTVVQNAYAWGAFDYNAENTIFSTGDVKAPLSVTQFWGMTVPVYDDEGFMRSYVTDHFRMITAYYDDDKTAENNRAIRDLSVGGVGFRPKHFSGTNWKTLSSDKTKLYIGTSFHETPYMDMDSEMRSGVIDIVTNTLVSRDEYYYYTDKDDEEQEIEKGTFITRGVYQVTHDNYRNLIYTINDKEPDNFAYNLTCDLNRCDYDAFNLFDNGNIIYNNLTGDDKLYVITGAPSTDDKPTMSLFANLYAPQYNHAYEDTLPEALLLQNSSTVITYPYDYTAGDYSLDNPPVIDKEHLIYERIPQTTTTTSQAETAFMVQAFDKTSDDVHIAYDCDYGGTAPVVDGDNYEDDYATLYERYNSTCELSRYDTPDIIASQYLEDTNSLLLDRYCADNITFGVSVPIGTSINTFVTNTMIGEGKGIEMTFLNRYDDELATLTIRHYKDESVNYAVIMLDDETLYNTTSTANIVNSNLDVQLSITEDEVTYNIGGLAIGTMTKTNTLPISSINYEFFNKTNTTAEPDYVLIGSWAVITTPLFPEVDEGVSYVTTSDDYQYYVFMCDYADYDGEETYLRVYYDDTEDFTYSRYKDYNIVYDSTLELYDLPLEAEGVLTDEEAVASRQAESRAFACTVFGVCDETGRLFLALIIMLVATFGVGAFMHNNYEPTFLAQVLPAMVYVLLFIFFASTGFLPTWFVIANVVLMVGAGAVVLNPVLWTQGGGGGRY